MQIARILREVVQRTALALSLATLLLSAGGCGQSKAELDDEFIAELATLAGLKQSTRAELRNHHEQLTTDRATPIQMQVSTVADEDNVAAALIGLFPRKSLESQLQSAEARLRVTDYHQNSAELAKLMSFTQRWAKRRQVAADALLRPQCNFGVQHTRGWYGNERFQEPAALYVRIESVLALERLTADEPSASIAALARGLRMTEHLSRARDLDARLWAAQLRREQMEVLSRILEHPKTNTSIVEPLFTLLLTQLDNWPNDAEAWLGERCKGLISYEAVRRGYFGTLLTSAEVHEARQLGGVAAQNREALNHADDDQLFYLDQMRRLIGSCYEGEGDTRRAVPLFRRYHVVEEIQAAIDSRVQQDENYPILTARLFLRNIQEPLILQAKDSALVEMWVVGLAHVLGKAEPALQTNPVNGATYQVMSSPGRFIVSSKNPTIDGLPTDIVVMRQLGESEPASAQLPSGVSPR